MQAKGKGAITRKQILKPDTQDLPWTNEACIASQQNTIRSPPAVAYLETWLVVAAIQVYEAKGKYNDIK